MIDSSIFNTSHIFNIFKNQKILITGDTGFKGSWLAFWLSELGAEIMGYALPPEPHQQLFNLLKLNQRITHVDGDVRDFDQLNKVIKDFSPTFIFHLAAQPLVRLSYQAPRETFATNILGSTHILEAARTCESLRVLIYVTSDKCYKNKEQRCAYREDDILGGYDPYSASKAAAEIIFSSYLDSFFSQMLRKIGVASVRSGNVIGGGDWSVDRIVPDVIKALQENLPISIRNPQAVRPWQHVLDPLSGYLKLAARLYHEPKLYQGSWNFGPESSSGQCVEQLVDEIITIWGEGEKKLIKPSQSNINHLHEADFLTLNCDKAHQLLQWRPQWDFAAAVRQTVEWYQGVYQGEDPLEMTRRQLVEWAR